METTKLNEMEKAYAREMEKAILALAIARENMDRRSARDGNFTPAEQAWLAAFRREPDA